MSVPSVPMASVTSEEPTSRQGPEAGIAVVVAVVDTFVRVFDCGGGELATVVSVSFAVDVADAVARQVVRLAPPAESP